MRPVKRCSCADQVARYLSSKKSDEFFDRVNNTPNDNPGENVAQTLRSEEQSFEANRAGGPMAIHDDMPGFV